MFREMIQRDIDNINNDRLNYDNNRFVDRPPWADDRAPWVDSFLDDDESLDLQDQDPNSRLNERSLAEIEFTYNNQVIGYEAGTECLFCYENLEGT